MDSLLSALDWCAESATHVATQGNALGCGEKGIFALKGHSAIPVLPLQGECSLLAETQGVALGYDVRCAFSA